MKNEIFHAHPFQIEDQFFSFKLLWVDIVDTKCLCVGFEIPTTTSGNFQSKKTQNISLFQNFTLSF
jgi:hypothetical protein